MYIGERENFSESVVCIFKRVRWTREDQACLMVELSGLSCREIATVYFLCTFQYLLLFISLSSPWEKERQSKTTLSFSLTLEDNSEHGFPDVFSKVFQNTATVISFLSDIFRVTALCQSQCRAFGSRERAG